METVPHVKPKLTDVEITKPVSSEKLARTEFTRVYAVNMDSQKSISHSVFSVNAI